MGKIKSKAVRKAAKNLTKEGVSFTENFDNNKKILEGLSASKKIRNQVAGLLAKLNKNRQR